MPVNSTLKTEWEVQAKAVYLLDPDTGEPTVALDISADSNGINLAEYGGVAVGPQNPVDVKTSGTTISQTPTITAGAYAEGDAVGGLLTFANAEEDDILGDGA